ncbi:MAG: DUF2865 domain-containing protein [Pseudolabrys sp.]|nr:DUF2865 domain-containing protein [Pseudolabrys sp.]
MAFQSQKPVLRAAKGLVWGLVGLGLLTVAWPQPATAGFFERLFGGQQRREAPRPPTNVTAFVDPFTSLANHFNEPPAPQERVRTSARGPSKAFCVRTCDGRYFPVRAHAGMSAAESCRSFCPASETRLFGGSNIDYATTHDGSRYADLPTAFLYRKQMVAGCTCNGRDAFGLAHVDAANDPTLRRGDIVATSAGLQAFTGARDSVAEFTPVQNYTRLSKAMRDRLTETKVGPAAPETADLTASIPTVAARARAAAPAR